MVLDVLNLLAALGAGVVGGVFYAFSTFVMKALRRLPARDAIAAMQSINVVVINPMFLGVFLGTALMSLVVSVMAVLRWDPPQSMYLIVGAALYLVGTFGVTVVCNVPLNETLAKVSGEDSDAAERWEAYCRRWTAWNHVRTVAAVGACGSLVMALMQR